MENKYYTPQIEEFRVGFEYEIDEYKDGESEWKRDRGYWREETYDLNYPSKDYLEQMISFGDGLRVKYLDSSDIKNLGFTKVEPDRVRVKLMDAAAFRLQEYTITFYPYLTSIPEQIKGKLFISKHIDYGEYKDNHESMLFIGYIKNISELKVLLSQLGILDSRIANLK